MPVTKIEHPCWEAHCDNCGEAWHHASLEALIEDLHQTDWTVILHQDGTVKALYCYPCWDDFSDERRAEILADALAASDRAHE